MEDLRRRLLLAEDNNLVELLEEYCSSEEGRTWCLERFSVADVLAMMWREKRGTVALLELWKPWPIAEPIVEALLPENYLAERLVQVLFPLPGRYRLEEERDRLIGPNGEVAAAGLSALLRERLAGVRLPNRLRMEHKGTLLSFQPESAEQRITLGRRLLEESGADVVGYGAADTGEMAEGAAAAILVACGPEIEQAARVELGQRSRAVGEVFLTPAFGNLARGGTRWVCHIVSVIKDFAVGATCPEPDLLEGAVFTGLKLAHDQGAESMALSALGTGQGGVQPAHCARMMIGAARKFFRDHPDSPLMVRFCLPNEQDYAAFEAELSRRAS